MKGVTKTFRKEFPISPVKVNVAEAKTLMEKGMKELGIKAPLSLVFLTTDGELAAKEAEYMQNLFKTTLGIDLKIDKQIFKQRLAKQQAGEFDILSAAWGPDYMDPMTFVDLFSSWNGNNSGQWSNADYDKHVRNAMSTVDQKVRMAAMGEAEKILLEELTIIPTYERTLMYIQSKRLTGVIRRITGADPDFTETKIVE